MRIRALKFHFDRIFSLKKKAEIFSLLDEFMVLMLYGGQPLDLAHYPSLMNAAIYYDIRGGVLNGAHRKGERVSWEHFVQDYFKWNDK